MPLVLGWREIAARLAWTAVAALIIGFNRGSHGRPAGIRTTLLVCMAASLSMIEANLLLNTGGKTPGSFAVLDLMRFPLGILSGMGFIGAGTILRKGSLVMGVTTAATLWFTTMMGLCFGGGQIGLGVAALVIGTAALWGLEYLESFLRQDERGTLRLSLAADGIDDEALRRQIAENGCKVLAWSIADVRGSVHREISCEIQWRSRLGSAVPPRVIETLRNHPATRSLRWQPQGMPDTSEPPQTEPKGLPPAISG